MNQREFMKKGIAISIASGIVDCCRIIDIAGENYVF